jgi:hypothetical protein
MTVFSILDLLSPYCDQEAVQRIRTKWQDWEDQRYFEENVEVDDILDVEDIATDEDIEDLWLEQD